MTIQITSVVPRDMMTEEEVNRAAALIQQLENLRTLRGERYGRLVSEMAVAGGYCPPVLLSTTDLEATIAFLIERFTAELTMLGVKPKETPK